MINQLNQQLERVDDLMNADICTQFEFETMPREILGRGNYGKVYKMKNKFDNQYYAVKCINKQNEKEGFPITSLREQNLLHHQITKRQQQQNGLILELKKQKQNKANKNILCSGFNGQ